jgi:shikimate kinase
MGRLVLVGLPGTGKTTVARALGASWSCDVLDTDDLVALEAGVSAAALLRDEGEDSFRRHELAALHAALAGDADVVVATGGGIVCTPAARAVLAAECTLWLDCDDDVILNRLGDVERPLLAAGPAEALAALRRERTAWYRDVARARIDGSQPLDEVVASVTNEVGRLAR